LNYWIISDTHFSHSKIHEFCNRPSNYESLIIKHMHLCIRPDDILIHLGDIAWHNENIWNRMITSFPANKKWLMRGNHDTRSNNWYLNRGWDFIGDSMTLTIYKKIILFSHKPVPDGYYDFNIHGHFHNIDSTRFEPELSAALTDKHILIRLEHTYTPITLKHIIKTGHKYNKTINLLGQKSQSNKEIT